MEYLPSYNDEITLAHHGILGMKWGVRRYQNEDGTLTDEGKARQKRWKGPDTLRYRLANRKADKGDALRARGKTITGNSVKSFYTRMGIAALGVSGAQALRGTNISFRWGDKKLGSLNSDVIANGATAVSVLYGIKTSIDNSRIRASYRRDYSRSDYWAG